MSTTITEADMAQAFARYMAIPENSTFLPHFTGMEPEVDCLQGRPDFIGVQPDRDFDSPPWITALAQALATPSLASIVASLKRRAPRREEYLLRVTGMSRPVVRRAIADLERRGIVEQMGGGYVLGSNVPTTHPHLWAFELKLDHWQRALFQAYQYRAFAHAAIVVMSEPGVRRVERHYARFEAHGVGLMAFDAAKHELRLLVRPARQQPLSHRHYLYALGRILARQL